MTGGARFFGEQTVEFGERDFGAFKPRPGVGVMVLFDHPADEFLRQAVLAFVPSEVLDRRGGEYAAEIENDRFYSHGLNPVQLFLKPNRLAMARSSMRVGIRRGKVQRENLFLRIA